MPLKNLNSKNLVKSLIKFRYGENMNAESKDSFIHDLQIHAARRKDDTSTTQPSKTSFINWVKKNKPPTRKPSFEFLNSYFMNCASRKELSSDVDAALETSIRNFFAKFEFADESEDIQEKVSAQSSVTGMFISSVVDKSLANPRSEHDDFFPGSSKSTGEDTSYFLCYRFGTEGGLIVKSFLAIMQPKNIEKELYRYQHFMWGGGEYVVGNNFSSNNTFRECSGIILKADSSYHFLGYNYVVPVNPREQEREYQDRRQSSRFNVAGIGMTVLEYEEAKRQTGVLSAVTLTSAAMNQPVLSRCAMVHIGTESGLNFRPDHRIARPCELLSNNIRKDLEKTIEDFDAKGCSSFTRALSSATSIRDGGDNLTSLSKVILNLIDNKPAWTSNNGAAVAFEGAIETFGWTPGSRPRL